MIYRLSVYSDSMGHEGYQYFSSRRAAQRALSDLVKEGYDPDYFLDIEAAPTPRTKADVIRLLETWAHHPNNG